MKRAFTLVELLIVVVILVTLMTIAFRLGGIGSDAEARAWTVQRMQRLENALSGYYAAFGMYPPVKLHGERDIYLPVDGFGLQSDTGEHNEDLWGWVDSTGTTVNNTTKENKAWLQVQAACLSQPVACEFPFKSRYRVWIEAVSGELQSQAAESTKMPESRKSVCQAGFDDGVSSNKGRFKSKESSWSETQLFKFGVLSFLLPRYLIMMTADDSDDDLYTDFTQWTANNGKPCDPITGSSNWTWSRIKDYANSTDGSDLMHVANIPSQAVCARWIANFENALECNYSCKIFGVELRRDSDYNTLPSWNENSQTFTGMIYNPNGYSGGSSGSYVLDCITMRDGWNHDFYYYSPSPHQSYTVWSSGKNGRTFPPWISREKLSADAKRCVGYWTQDDIVGLKN